MDISSLNWLAVIASAVMTFVVGGIWYGSLFGQTWMDEMGFTEEELKEANMVKIYGIAFVLELIMAINLAMFIGEASVSEGALYGFLTGFGWVALAMGVNALFSRSSFKLWFINSFYFVITFTLMGVILTAWR
ncbi:DUF1761 domain-containing protein [Marinoscillum luteum]|uniref:DUF1761 domain-containing protein n=1 Tax=Marinoscillum luteum TaxID=861051 RepID=A0ABW7NBU7_9BACT